MKTITIKPRQTIYDVALEQYGTCEAVGDILRLNPELENDSAALAARGINSVGVAELWFDVALDPGQMLVVDPDNGIRKSNIIKELRIDITTYENGTDN